MKKTKLTSYLISFSVSEGLEIKLYRQKNKELRGVTAYLYENENHLVFFQGVFSPDFEMLLRDKRNYIKNLSNTFTIFIFNKISNNLEVCTDEFGLQTVFWTRKEDTFYFSNLVYHFNDFIALEINPEQYLNYLSLGYISPYNESYYKNINILKPNSRNIFLEQKHELIIEESESTSYVEFDLDKIIESLKRPLNEIENPFFGITSGLDSSALLSIYPKKKKLNTGTFGIEGSDDIERGKAIADLLGLEYNQIDLVNKNEFLDYAKQISYFTSGMGTLSYVDMLKFVSESIRDEECFVMGEGGECIRDFFSSKDTTAKDEVFQKYFSPKNELLSIISDSLKNELDDYPKNQIEKFKSKYTQFSDEYFIEFYREIRLKGNFALRTSILQSEVDKYAPFLEKDFKKLTFNLETNYFKDSHIHRQIIKNQNQELYNIINTPIKKHDVQNWAFRFKNGIGQLLLDIVTNFEYYDLPINKENLILGINKNIETPSRGIYLIFRIVDNLMFMRLFNSKNSPEILTEKHQIKRNNT